MENRKHAFKFWTGNPHPGWENTVQEPEKQLGGLVKAWWMASCPALYCNWWQCSIDPDYLETTSWGGHQVLLEAEQRTWGDLFCGPQHWGLNTSSNLTNPIKNAKGLKVNRGTFWQVWRQWPGLILGHLGIIHKSVISQCPPKPQPSPFVQREELGFLWLYLSGDRGTVIRIWSVCLDRVEYHPCFL